MHCYFPSASDSSCLQAQLPTELRITLFAVSHTYGTVETDLWIQRRAVEKVLRYIKRSSRSPSLSSPEEDFLSVSSVLWAPVCTHVCLHPCTIYPVPTAPANPFQTRCKGIAKVTQNSPTADRVPSAWSVTFDRNIKS